MSQAAFKDHFSAHADAYARYRPDYPPALFAWLAEIAPSRGRAWDCATGSGQAAVALAEHFAEVIASDASETQVRSAFPHPRVSYRVAPAERSGIEDASVDAITVAQAVHWFDIPAFYREAERVLKPGGVLAVWAYAVFASTPEIDRVVDHLYREIVGPYWPPDRGMIERGYEDVHLPFDPVDPPSFAMEKDWTLDDAIGYLGTWSATRGYLAARGHDPVALVRDELAAAWGGGTQRVWWPLFLKVARKAG
jgi:SAM-dependent methyltransferase